MSKTRANPGTNAYLYLEDGAEVFRIKLKLDRYELGSAPENDIQVNDPRVAKRHCSIRRQDGGFVVVARNRSVWVDGRLVAREKRLVHGAIIDLEGTELTFVDEAEAVPITLQLGVATTGSPHWFGVFCQPEISIGRSPAGLTVDDPGMEDYHLSVENFGPELVFVRSRTRSTPIELNRQPLEARRRLMDGDRIRTSLTEIAFSVLEQPMPTIEEPLEWRRDAPSATPIARPPGAPPPTEPQATTLDVDEERLAAQQLDEARRSRRGDETAKPQRPSPIIPSPTEDNFESTMLVDKDALAEFQREKRRAARGREVAAKEAAARHGASAAPTNGNTRPTTTPANAHSGRGKRRSDRARVNPRKAVQTGSRALNPDDRRRMENETRLNLDMSEYFMPTRPDPGGPTSGDGSGPSKRARTMVCEDGSADGVAPVSTTHSPQRAHGSAPQRQQRAKSVNPSARPYYLPQTEPVEQPDEPAAKPSKAYYMPGQQQRKTGTHGQAQKRGGSLTMTEIPTNAQDWSVDDDDGADHYYIPADARANEARRRSRADYYETAEERRDAARERLRLEQGRAPARNDAHHVASHDLGAGLRDMDFDANTSPRPPRNRRESDGQGAPRPRPRHHPDTPEGRRDAARERLRREQGRAPARSDARSVSNNDLAAGLEDVDFND